MPPPVNPTTALNEALALHQAGGVDAALSVYEAVLAAAPENIDALHLSGVALHQLGRMNDARLRFERALVLRPQWPEALNNFGNLLRAMEQLPSAEASYRKAIQLRPDFAEAFMNLGVILRLKGLPVDAEAMLRRAVELAPTNPLALMNLSNLFQDIGNNEAAVTYLQKAAALAPNHPDIQANLAVAMQRSKRDSESETAFRKAIALRPNHGPTRANYASLLLRQARFDHAIAELRLAVECDPASADLHSNLLFALSYARALPPDALMQEHLSWAKRHGVSSPAISSARPRAADGRMRIGYVSADFRTHAVAHFIAPVLGHHDRANVEVFCYSNTQTPDLTTRELMELCPNWRNISGMSDDDFATLVARDSIDVLVDLSGHTAGHRLTAFSRRLAPVQATYIGYFSTTGLAAMDYWITDAVLHPAETPERTVETLWRLPRCWVCYQPPAEAPEVSPPPSSRGRPITFGSFNHLNKINGPTIARWARVLNAVPDARLLLKTSDLAAEHARERIRRQFNEHGIAPERLLLRGDYTSIRDHFAAYADVDIALDPFPTCGGTTTADALWMGVPVITVPGHSLVERMSASMLTAIGHPELIAENESDFVAKARALATSPAELVMRRASQRSDMRQSPLTDARGLARELEKAYEEMLRAKGRETSS